MGASDRRVITFTFALEDHAARCLAQLRELRRDNGLCEDCGNAAHGGGECRPYLSYYDRKALGVCTYPGCLDACSETSVQCETHRAGTTERKQRERTGRMRAIRG
jgi:hypothetical protein